MLPDAIDGRDRLQKICWDRIIDTEHHHRIAAHDFAAHLHGSDVDVVFAQQRAQVTNDSGHVPVPGEQHVAAGGHIHREGIDAGDAQIAIGKDGTGDAAAALITTGGDLQ